MSVKRQFVDMSEGGRGGVDEVERLRAEIMKESHRRGLQEAKIDDQCNLVAWLVRYRGRNVTFVSVRSRAWRSD